MLGKGLRIIGRVHLVLLTLILTRLFTANIFRRFPTAKNLTPYIGAGLGISVPYVDIQRMDEGRTFEYQLAGPAAILVLGAIYRINDRWSVFGEY